jgi:uncharacterized protein (AIM24 family)
MRDPSPRAPFDQGLFLTHFNKGKGLYDERRYDEAERELEEAYLLRPRDQKVLNLLGLVYFRQEKLEKAEEVYRKLAAESPDAHTLFYNLGLIYFKLNRLEEAESAFAKALEISRENPKINFYLGSIYERLHRFQDAIYQYRQAGANLMVRRVEDKIAAGTQPGTPRPPREPGRKRRDDDTAEFKTNEIQEGMRQIAITERPLQPVSEVLLADNAPARDASTDTARFRVSADTDTRPPQPAPQVLSFPGVPSDGDASQTLPPRKGESFRFLQNNLMEIDFSGKIFIKQGTIYSYGGNLTFWVKEKRPGGNTALVIITGKGKVILSDKEREITFLHVQDEILYVEPSHLLACEETLTPRYLPLGEGSALFEVLALEGRGMVALSVASKPLALAVTPDLPVSAPAASIITWSGNLTAKVLDDPQLYQVMLSAPAERGGLVRLEGTGRVLVEQTLG